MICVLCLTILGVRGDAGCGLGEAAMLPVAAQVTNESYSRCANVTTSCALDVRGRVLNNPVERLEDRALAVGEVLLRTTLIIITIIIIISLLLSSSAIVIKSSLHY